MPKIMSLKMIILLVALFTAVCGHTVTLSGCHTHEGQEYCYLPNGSEVPFTRTATATSGGIQTTAPAAADASATSSMVIPSSVTSCHAHETQQFCMAGTVEYEVLTTPTATPLPTAYTNCHAHGASEIFCEAPDGTDVELALEGSEHSEEEEDHDEHGHAEETTGQNCHFHGTTDSTATCERVERNYNVPLRIGLLFVILAGSTFAVFAPILLQRFTKMSMNSIVFTILKQFGTGVIISTALVHLLTHAELQFANECLGALFYESTTTAIVMAGVFLSFLIEYIGTRLVARRSRNLSAVDSEQQSDTDKTASTAAQNTTVADLGHSHAGMMHPDNHFSVAVMESGILFHSILIGITLAVTPNSFFTTLFIVILFHQMFEGLALGTRIAALPASSSTITKLIMALIFALITPIGMAIGIGVLSHFNGNDPATIVAIGTLDALSAGILLWVGLVEMLAHDWMYGDMLRAGVLKVVVGLVSLAVGLVLMSVLGKWA